MNFRLACLLLCLILNGFQYVRSQNATDTADPLNLGFIHYLIGREEYKEAVFMLNKKLNQSRLQISYTDSLHHLLGWSYYSMKELDQSTVHFLQVSHSSPGYYKCRLFAAYNTVYKGDTAAALTMLNTLVPDTGWQTELLVFQKAGICLLKRDIPGFERLEKGFTKQVYALEQEEERFRLIADKISERRNKSMSLAALMSAVLPGSGKIYTGKTGEGVSSFLIVAALGLVTWENYRNDGMSDYKTILAASALSVYYIGNIWGSALAAHRQNQRFNHEINQRILFDLHIPLRSIFN